MYHYTLAFVNIFNNSEPEILDNYTNLFNAKKDLASFMKIRTNELSTYLFKGHIWEDREMPDPDEIVYCFDQISNKFNNFRSCHTELYIIKKIFDNTLNIIEYISNKYKQPNLGNYENTPIEQNNENDISFYDTPLISTTIIPFFIIP
jgi:hypothetical protein